MNRTTSCNLTKLERHTSKWNSDPERGYCLWPHSLQKMYDTQKRDYTIRFIDTSVIIDWKTMPLPKYSTVVSDGSDSTEFNKALGIWRVHTEQKHRESIQAEAEALWTRNETCLRRQREMEEQMRVWQKADEKLIWEEEREARDAPIIRAEVLGLSVLFDGYFPLEELPIEVLGLITDQVLKEHHPHGIIDLRQEFLFSVFRTTSLVRAVAIWRLLQASVKIMTAPDGD